MPGGIENSQQLKLYFGIQARKGKEDFRTLTMYMPNQGQMALEHTAQLEAKLPKHEVRLVPTTREGVAAGDPIPHKLVVPNLGSPTPEPTPAARKPKTSSPKKSSGEEVYDISGKTPKRVK
jgi:hypothetical protein